MCILLKVPEELAEVLPMLRRILEKYDPQPPGIGHCLEGGEPDEVDMGSDEHGIQETESPSYASREARETRKIFASLAALFPDRFEREDISQDALPAIHMFNPEPAVPKLKIMPFVKNSWLDPPSKLHTNDSVGIWPPGTAFPKHASAYPSHCKSTVPKRPVDIKMEDRLKDFLDGPLIKDGRLDSQVFYPDTCAIKTLPQVNMDKILRSGLSEGFLNVEYVRFLLEMIPLIRDEFCQRLSIPPKSSQEAEGTAFPTLDLMHNVLGLMAHGIHRNNNILISAYVNNKLSVRDHVLDRFKGLQSTKHVLRGSDFYTKEIFGPLPESFKDSLSSHNGKNLMCTIKDSSSSASTSASTSTSPYVPGRSKRSIPQRAVDSKRIKQGFTPRKDPKQFFPRNSQSGQSTGRPKTSRKKGG